MPLLQSTRNSGACPVCYGAPLERCECLRIASQRGTRENWKVPLGGEDPGEELVRNTKPPLQYHLLLLRETRVSLLGLSAKGAAVLRAFRKSAHSFRTSSGSINGLRNK